MSRRMPPALALRRALAEAGIRVNQLDDAAVARLATIAHATHSGSERVRLGAPRGAQHTEPALTTEAPIPVPSVDPAREEEPCLCEVCLRNASADGTPLIGASTD